MQDSGSACRASAVCMATIPTGKTAPQASQNAPSAAAPAGAGSSAARLLVRWCAVGLVRIS